MTTTEQETATALLDGPEPFRAWLERHTGQYVGYCGYPDRCPLAVYLHAQGLLSARVGSDLVWEFGDSLSARDLPIWAQIFVESIDSDRPCGVPISSIEALLTLRTAVAEAASETSHWSGDDMDGEPL